MTRRFYAVAAVGLLGISLVVAPGEAGAASSRPVVSKISRHSGSVVGGTKITITGKRFVKGTTVRFGKTKAKRVKRVSSKKLIVVAPRHAGGALYVQVRTKSGKSKTGKKSAYRYTVPSVSRLRVLSVGTTSVRLGWTNPRAGYSSLRVRRGSTVIASLPTGRTSFTDARLKMATRYAYSVTAYYRSTAPSAASTIATRTAGNIPAVRGLRATKRSDTSVELAWANPPSDQYAGLRVRRSSGSAPVSNMAGTVVATLPVGRTTFTNTGLVPGTEYNYAVTPFYGNAVAPTAPVVSATTTNVTPPGKVTDLVATPGVKQVGLTWRNPSDADLAGLRVCRTATTTTCVNLGVVDSYRDTKLNAGNYSYAVYARDTAGNYSGATTAKATVKNYTGPGQIQQPSSRNVTADALPTVQIDKGANGNGAVGWCQVVVGNTVYVGGDFSTARPAGAARGTKEVARHNVLAYDIRSGALITSFADPKVNGVVLAIAASPDGKRIYIGGSFTAVGGRSHPYLAALNAATGALDTSFAGTTGNVVRALDATSTGVYAGGDFFTARDLTQSSAVNRTRLARFDNAGGVLNWTPSADSTVRSMVLTPDGSKLVVGGSFVTLAGATVLGIGAVTAGGTGTAVTWRTSEVANNYGANAGITSLTTDGDRIYGTGFNFMHELGNLEGTFAADADDGTVEWVEDCHGDSYGSTVQNGIVYVVSHAHYCRNVGGWTDQNPAVWKHAMAFTTDATGVLYHQPNAGGYHDFGGTPSPSIIDWFPTLAIGTYTGQYQSAWAVTGNSDYIVQAGEFATVNGKGQQGLVRFARRGIAPLKAGPQTSASDFTPNVTRTPTTTITVKAAWDMDGLAITYRVLRNGKVVDSIPTQRVSSTWWIRPTLTFKDTSRPSGTQQYRVQAIDDDGNTITSPQVTSN